ncbi:hypothetical protein HNP84_008490 [Thermocatellispora tengchongensis]|uniref:Uncharacterized protein n=1 Tax=Thermocatellispora tengchongensis TaxID=1073253 RepID=A0A840PHW4_9ACTN|nr:hypothetical protein [Thermocatellispora tengchongensis]MBB5138732.1 hypothetical protein [Thermocatellispora tengchongensis]
MTVLSHALVAVSAVLLTTPAVIYMFSADPGRRSRALRLLRLLLRR